MRSKFGRKEIVEILDMARNGKKMNEISVHFGCSRATIQSIFCGTRYAEYTGFRRGYSFAKFRKDVGIHTDHRNETRSARLDKSDVDAMLVRAREGKNIAGISNEIGIPREIIRRVFLGKSYNKYSGFPPNYSLEQFYEENGIQKREEKSGIECDSLNARSLHTSADTKYTPSLEIAVKRIRERLRKAELEMNDIDETLVKMKEEEEILRVRKRKLSEFKKEIFDLIK